MTVDLLAYYCIGWLIAGVVSEVVWLAWWGADAYGMDENGFAFFFPGSYALLVICLGFLSPLWTPFFVFVYAPIALLRWWMDSHIEYKEKP